MTKSNRAAGLLRATVAALAIGLATFGCESGGTSTGGETHFLKTCDSGSEACGDGLSCVCGVCTRPCTVADECAELPAAECVTLADVRSCSGPPPAGRCDVVCNADVDCGAVSASHRCELNACRSGSGAGPDGSGGAPGDCERGVVEANQVLLLGDTFFALSHQITAYLEQLARDAGAIAVGERYRDNSTMVGNALAFGGNGIAGQYARGVEEASVEVVIMNGGGADVLLGRCDPPLEECPVLLDAADAADALFATMAADGISHVVYAFYPDPVDVALREEMDVLRPLIEGACARSPVPCHFLDLRPTFEGRYDQYVLEGGLNPTDAGSRASAGAIWALMRRECIAQ